MYRRFPVFGGAARDFSKRSSQLLSSQASGNAYVTLSGSMFYLGKVTASGKTEYEPRLAEWFAAGRRLPADPQETAIAELGSAFRKHARAFYSFCGL